LENLFINVPIQIYQKYKGDLLGPTLIVFGCVSVKNDHIKTEAKNETGLNSGVLNFLEIQNKK